MEAFRRVVSLSGDTKKLNRLERALRSKKKKKKKKTALLLYWRKITLIDRLPQNCLPNHSERDAATGWLVTSSIDIDIRSSILLASVASVK